MYPALLTQKQYGLGDIENRLEGFYRPGHFQGVCQAVDRLLQIVQPHNLYMGQKDYQQCMVIKKLLELTKREDDVKLVIVPTVRETDGLAMSSRNLRLSTEQRKLATSIFKELSFIKEHVHDQPFDGLKKLATEHLIQKGFKVDYVEIADAIDLTPAKDDTNRLVVLAAATTGEIRLIDNLVLN
jgi:pantoate--beta-alanine ligase